MGRGIVGRWRAGAASRMLAILGLTGCAHSLLPGPPLYTKRVPGGTESLRCLATSLQTAGYSVAERNEGELVAERPGSVGYDGELQATWVVRAYIDGEADPTMVVEVAIQEDRTTRTPDVGGPVPVGRDTRPVRRRDDTQARAAIRMEFDPTLARCAIAAEAELE